MTNLGSVVRMLKNEHVRLTAEIKAIANALSAFGVAYGNSKQTKRSKISAAGRLRIAAAQRARWTKARKGQKQNVAMPKKRTMSAAARRRISLAQKARWAKQRAAKPKRTISAAGRKRIAAAQRARWAKVKRAG